MNSVEEYIDKHPKWKKQLLVLRELLLSEGLEETIKWGGPVYMLNGKNLVSIGAFKHHYALWFFHGALLHKNTLLLENAQEGTTKAMRQIRFEGEEINSEEIRSYVLEATQNAKDGKKVNPTQAKKEVRIPLELEEAFNSKIELKTAFSELSPGKQREYVLYISEAKRQATKNSRLEKIIPMIQKGAGLNDKYKK